MPCVLQRLKEVYPDLLAVDVEALYDYMKLGPVIAFVSPGVSKIQEGGSWMDVKDKDENWQVGGRNDGEDEEASSAKQGPHRMFCCCSCTNRIVLFSDEKIHDLGCENLHASPYDTFRARGFHF